MTIIPAEEYKSWIADTKGTLCPPLRAYNPKFPKAFRGHEFPKVIAKVSNIIHVSIACD